MATPEAFDELMSALGERALIVTARHGETTAGCLIGFATQTSIEPRRFLVCLSDRNHTYRVAARGAEHLGVHLVPPGRMDLAELFGGETGDETDKLARCAWHEGPGGVPLLDGCPDRFAGRVVDRHPLGDHVGFLLEPVAVDYGGGEAMGIGWAAAVDPGHQP
jgi:flavin reductase (DIM6/NTAB) family NADH-FMN oxidoreductase RutF